MDLFLLTSQGLISPDQSGFLETLETYLGPSQTSELESFKKLFMDSFIKLFFPRTAIFYNR